MNKNQLDSTDLNSTNFSPAEQRIVAFVVQGLSNKETASKLNINVKTVKFHTTNIYKKCRVKSRAEFLLKFYANAVTESGGAKNSYERLYETAKLEIRELKSENESSATELQKLRTHITNLESKLSSELAKSKQLVAAYGLPTGSGL